jgi:threonine dehydrogenase-like Zn-dependent dehydrogenase
MRAVILEDGIRFESEHQKPKPGGNECLIRVTLAGICSTDLELAKGYMGFRGVLGHEFVGVVEDGPADWIRSRRGRRVVSQINCVCATCDMCTSGLSNHCRNRSVIGIVGRDGCFADYVTVPTENVLEVPESLQNEQAVFAEPLAAAIQVTRQYTFDERSRVAVVGTGRLGLLVAQILSRTGCKLTVVGRNPKSLAFCDRLHLQTIHSDDVTGRGKDGTGDRDVVVECTGAAVGLDIATSMVRPRGTIILKSTFAGSDELNLAPIVIHEINLLGSRCGPFDEALRVLQAGEVEVLTMISKTFSPDKAEEAFVQAASPDSIKVILDFSDSRAG